MANDKVTIWNGGLKIGRAPANGELLIGNGYGFTLANITAGAGATVTNTAGGIEIGTTGIGTVGVANGGTGQTSLTANNVILGDGTSPVKFVAPGTSGNVLTSNGTTWASSAPTWTRVVKASDQTFSSTTFADDTTLKFSVSASKKYAYRATLFLAIANTGGFKFSVNGPASPTYLLLGLSSQYNAIASAYDSILFQDTTNVGVNVTFGATGVVSNGSNAGTVALRWAQASGPSGTLTVYAGSWIEWAEIG